MVNVLFLTSMTSTEHMQHCWNKLRICILVHGKGSNGRLNKSEEEVCEFYKLYVWKTEETHQYSERTSVQQQCCLIFIIFPIRVSPAHFETLRKAPTGLLQPLIDAKGKPFDVNTETYTLPSHKRYASSHWKLTQSFHGLLQPLVNAKIKRCTFCTVPCQPWGTFHTYKNTKARKAIVQCFTVLLDVLNDYVLRTHRQAWFLSSLFAKYSPLEHGVLKVTTWVVHS